jgi:hypothetical protein
MTFRYGYDISRNICSATLWSSLTRNFLWQIGGEVVRRVERVLDVRQGELCWVAGTVYMDMPLKPNILDDISKDVCYRKLGVSEGR